MICGQINDGTRSYEVFFPDKKTAEFFYSVWRYNQQEVGIKFFAVPRGTQLDPTMDFMPIENFSAVQLEDLIKF
jgi:hypothetical protein